MKKINIHTQRIKPKTTFMTTDTYLRLKNELIFAEAKLKEMLKETGDMAGEKCDWHDNAAYDQACRDAELARARVQELEELLVNVQIIVPRQEVDSIGIGNLVEIVLGENGSLKIYTLLGPRDGSTNPKWLSVETPLGSCLLGKKIGENAEYEINGRKTKVHIQNILPGEFRYQKK